MSTLHLPYLQAINSTQNTGLVIPALWARTPSAGERFVDYFTSNIRNHNTRRAYMQALESEDHKLIEIATSSEADLTAAALKILDVFMISYPQSPSSSKCGKTALPRPSIRTLPATRDPGNPAAFAGFPRALLFPPPSFRRSRALSMAVPSAL
jgi:hypothetical protein